METAAACFAFLYAGTPLGTTATKSGHVGTCRTTDVPAGEAEAVKNPEDLQGTSPESTKPGVM